MESKKLTIIIISGFVIFSVFLFFGLIVYFYSQKSDAPDYYKQGLTYYQNGDFQNAYYNFSKVMPLSDIYYNALFRSAKSADAISDYKTAIRNYTIFNFLLKDKNVSPFILWRLGNLYYESGKTAKAKNTFLDLIKLYPESEYGIASYYMLSKIIEEKKLEYSANYIKYSPKGKYAKEITKLLLDNLELLDTAQKAALAVSLSKNEEYALSITVFKDIPIQYSWIYMLNALDKLHSSKNVIKVANKGILLDNSHYDENALSDAVSVFARHYGGRELGAYEYIYNNAKDKRLKAIALYKSSLLLNKNDSIKRKLFLSEKFPDSKYAPYALYDVFIEAYKENKTALALKYAKIHLALYKNKDTTPNVLYFVSCIKKKIHDKTYKDNIKRLLEEYTNTYYAYRAYSKENDKNFMRKRNLPIKTKNLKIGFPYGDNKKVSDFFENFSALNDLSPYDDFRIQDILIKSWIEYKKGNRALSSVYARDYINSSDVLPDREHTVWKLAYPIYYAELINKYSEINDLNPYLILSLIKEESHFNPSIQSYVGASGLMQIMPSTASMLSLRKYSYSDLIDEELNISLGTKYFKYLMDIFSNNEMLCILGYNSGPNALLRWIKKNESASFDILVENIPYGETKNYVKKVYAAYWNYLLTYEKIKI